MNLTRVTTALVGTALCLGPTFAEEKKPATATQKAAPAASPADHQMPPEMQEWMKYASPGEHHAHLKPMAGKWKTASKMWMDPNAPPQESTGTSDHKLILGDRFLMQDFTGDMMGQPFMGHGLTGYDNYKKKYVGMWCDTMGTLIMMSEGTCDGTGKNFTFTGEFDDPGTKTKKTIREVIRIESDTKHVFEMYDQDKSGKEWKTLEVIYTKM